VCPDSRRRPTVALDTPPVNAPGRCRQATTEIVLSKGACNSIQNASTSMAGTDLVRITHPFHPLSGKQLVCVAERCNRYGKRLLLQVDDGTICSVPQDWTDLVTPDPEIVIGKHRAFFRVADLLELARLVDQLGRGHSTKKADRV
jgi:hypothetical protein